MRVLVVEDDTDIRAILTDVLTDRVEDPDDPDQDDEHPERVDCERLDGLFPPSELDRGQILRGSLRRLAAEDRADD